MQTPYRRIMMQIFEVDEKMTKLTWQTTVSDNNKFEEIEEDC
jgi:hypothetical protein